MSLSADECSCGLEIGGCRYPYCPQGEWQDCPTCHGENSFCAICSGAGVVRVELSSHAVLGSNQ